MTKMVCPICNREGVLEDRGNSHREKYITSILMAKESLLNADWVKWEQVWELGTIWEQNWEQKTLK